MKIIIKKFHIVSLYLLIVLTMTIGLSSVAFAATGDISDTVIANLEHQAGVAQDPEIVAISSNYYAVVYKNSAGGTLRTFYISSNGATITQIDSYDFATGGSIDEPEIVKIEGSNYYAVAYRAYSVPTGEMFTIQISSTGTITKTKTDTQQYDTSYGGGPQMMHVSGDYYVIVYTGPSNIGYIKTFTINSSGAIGDTPTDTLNSGSIIVQQADLIHVTGDYYAISFRGPDEDGNVITISINSSGEIGDNATDLFEFDGEYGATPKMIHIYGDVYAIVYSGTDEDGYLITLTVNNSGEIGDSVIDSLEYFSAGDVDLNPDIIHVADSVYAIVNQNSTNSFGHVRTFTIGNDGSLPASEDDKIDELVFNSNVSFNPEIVNVSGDTYAVTYYASGKITTFSIESGGSSSIPEFGTEILILLIALGLGLTIFKSKKPEVQSSAT